MSVVGHNGNELASLHLSKTYRVPAALYGCETWYLDTHDYHRLNITRNNSFRKSLAAAGEKASHVFLFHCDCLRLSYVADQRKILFWKKSYAMFCVLY